MKRIFQYLKHKPNIGLWYPKDTSFDLITYTDADYAGSIVNRNSTSDTCQLLSSMIVFWFCKKQNFVALFTAEAEYVIAGSCCA